MSMHVEQGLTTAIAAGVLAAVVAALSGVGGFWGFLLLVALYFVFAILLTLLRGGRSSWGPQEGGGDASGAPQEDPEA